MESRQTLSQTNEDGAAATFDTLVEEIRKHADLEKLSKVYTAIDVVPDVDPQTKDALLVLVRDQAIGFIDAQLFAMKFSSEAGDLYAKAESFPFDAKIKATVLAAIREKERRLALRDGGTVTL